ncbi:Rac GTPase-activating protein 1 [Sciurus carolinensis]|uniref:Rac GTPase-activating protein 1 n=1 Tax=Sciurus carolinensis TaxID=30640 RepID=A0AA41MVQ5_SCICA|nr:Rac GTPase-activating protein 1 [Sciurus carolinensis]
MKAETERSALDVKLKHARNQVDVEIKRRQRAEADCEKLERQIQLIREMLMCDTSGSIQLSEEQKSALAFLNRGQPSSGNAGNKRLSTIDESGSILSDISFDKTDESLRSNSRQFVDGPPGPVKKTRSIGSTVDQGNESIVAKTTVTVPNDGGPIEAVSTIETVPYLMRSRRKTGTLQPWNSDSTLNSRPLEPRTENDSSGTPQSNGGMRLHDFVSKTVIKPESCVPCGKRIKFGKLSLKCRDCRVVSHPECRDRCPLPCIPTLIGTPVKIGETGLYRISGCDRTVKELKEKFLRVKTVPLLSKVDDIHAICSLLKDFLRNLKEPLLTFRLNKAFMEAAEITDEDNSIAAMYQAVGELPQANRDTLAFLMIHLQRLVVERLLSLPLEYWSQFMMVEQENIDPLHVIENSNAFSTPQTPDIKGNSSSYDGGFPTGHHELFTIYSWDDQKVRRVFIRKVYTILLIQLLVTLGVVALFTFWRHFPWNLILLTIFTLSMAYLTGMLSSYYNTTSVLLCLGITALVCLSVTVFSFQTKFDFTSCQGVLFVLLMTLFFSGLILAILLPFQYVPWLHAVYAVLGAGVFTLFLAFDTQLLMGNRRHSLSPEEYIFGALNIYLDIIYIFTFFLQLFGTNRE